MHITTFKLQRSTFVYHNFYLIEIKNNILETQRALPLKWYDFI